MGELKAKLILEIMGRPPEHIKEALKLMVDKLGEEKGVKILDSKLNEPEAVKDAKDLFMTFSELDIEFDSLNHFFAVNMGYMPSHVEVYEPEKFKMDSHQVNELGNFIVAKLHRYDEIVKRVMAERDILFRQLQHIKDGGKIEDLVKPVSEEKKDSKVSSKKKA